MDAEAVLTIDRSLLAVTDVVSVSVLFVVDGSLVADVTLAVLVIEPPLAGAVTEIVIAGAAPTAAGTITITPTVTGTILYRGRGYCNITQQPTTNLVVVFIGANGIDTGTNAERAFVRPPLGAGTLNQVAWTAERSFPATAGVAITTSLLVNHQIGAFVDDCSGTFTAEQLLP